MLMAEKVSRKLKRKSDQFYSEIEECEANEVKKKKSEDLSSQVSKCIDNLNTLVARDSHVLPVILAILYILW